MKKRIAILGSTGSIGTQALEVIAAHPDLFEAEILTAWNNTDLLISQAMQFVPNAVVIGNKESYKKVRDALSSTPVKVYAGDESICQVVEGESVDLVLSALVGYAGLIPTLHALQSGKHVALANKETLVVAGQLVMDAARKSNSWVLPVDSEHSAIFQCLVGEDPASLEKIILTASGGPFLGHNRQQLSGVTSREALRHPNWKMGNKVTIDSATLMNKGLEVIEARWLFDVDPGKIEVVVHPQSVIHSLVQFHDGSIKAQMGLPDMKLPIVFAMSFPERIQTEFPRFSFGNYPSLTFQAPDRSLFRNLDLAYEALERGGNMPCILNAANEVAVAAFLEDRISFLQMAEVIETCMAKTDYIKLPGLEDLVATHRETVNRAKEYAGCSKQPCNQ